MQKINKKGNRTYLRQNYSAVLSRVIKLKTKTILAERKENSSYVYAEGLQVCNKMFVHLGLFFDLLDITPQIFSAELLAKYNFKFSHGSVYMYLNGGFDVTSFNRIWICWQWVESNREKLELCGVENLNFHTFLFGGVFHRGKTICPIFDFPHKY